MMYTIYIYMICYDMICDMIYDIFVNCNWVATRYSSTVHIYIQTIHREKHNENRTYVTTRIHKQTIKIHMVPSPSIRVLVACRYAARVRTDCREKVVGRA